MLEIRSSVGLSSNGKTLHGHAARFNSEADLGGFVEVIRNGAFRKTLESGSNVRALYDHLGAALLGTTRGGTLRLKEDAEGLAFELALPDTSYGRDLAILVERGDVAGCSFGFRVAPGGDRWEQRGAQTVRELLSVELMEVTLTSNPAYADTTVAMRSMAALEQSRNLDQFLSDPVVIRRAWLETCRP